MNWTSVAVMAVVGALAGVITGFLVKDQQENRFTAIAIFLVLMAGLGGVAKKYVIDPLDIDKQMARAETELLQIPAFQTIKQYDPQGFQAFMNEVKTGIKNGTPQKEIIPRARQHVQKIIKTSMPRASNEAIISYMKVMTEEMRVLRSKESGLCYSHLFPKPGTPVVNVKDYISKDLMNADLAALNTVIQTAAQSPLSIPTEASITESLQLVAQRVESQSPGSLVVMQALESPTVDKDRACDVVLSLYEQALALSPSDGGPLLRYLLSQG